MRLTSQKKILVDIFVFLLRKLAYTYEKLHEREDRDKPNFEKERKGLYSILDGKR